MAKKQTELRNALTPLQTASTLHTPIAGDSSDDVEIESTMNPSVSYLVSLTLTLFCGTMSFGHALAATNFVWPALKAQLGHSWSMQHSVDWYSAILSAMATVGMALGSLFGSSMIRTGRHGALVTGNLLVVLGSIMSIVPEFWIISAGRMFVGFGAGMIMTTSPKFIEETVPPHLMGWGFGISTNVAMNFATLLDSLLALLMPGDYVGL